MFGHPGKKLLFMGSEFGQWREWHHDHSLDWHLLDDPAHAGLLRYVQALNWHLRNEPALHEVDFEPPGFRWIDCNDNDASIVAFVRMAHAPSDFVIVVVNFTPVPRPGYRIGIPEAGYYAELLNSDSATYGGSNVGNSGGVNSDPIKKHGFEHSINLTVPPLACLLLKRRP
jgi:1,4-alpha-glucan branching enzyme